MGIAMGQKEQTTHVWGGSACRDKQLLNSKMIITVCLQGAQFHFERLFAAA